ncbi:MAG TPA: nucleotide excision repair endonuclease [Acidobacteriota bacterium]|jgi:hypothetical protein
MTGIEAETENFSIVVATRRQIRGCHEFVEELFVQRWQGGEARREACRLRIPIPMRLTEELLEESPFSCRREGAGPEALKRCLRSPVLCWPDLNVALELLLRFAGWLPDSENSSWDFQDLWRAAFPRRGRKRVRLSEVAKHVGSTFQEPAKTRQVATLLGQAAGFLEENFGLLHLQQLVAGQQELDFSRYRFRQDYLDQLPETAGIYWMADSNGEIFYVGKSKNLSRRLRSYFIPPRHWDDKLARIHERLCQIEYLAVGSELEAFLEEARAIEKWKPQINTQLEVRERGSEYYRDADLVLVLPGSRKSQLHLFFVREGKFAGDSLYGGRRDQRSKLQERLRAIFFSGYSAAETWETHVLQSFIRQKLECTNHIDVRQASGAEQCVEWIERFRREPEERVVFR